MRNSNQLTIGRVSRGLTHFGISYPDVQRLIESLDQEDVHSRRAARSTLRSIGPASVPALAEALRSTCAAVRQGAAELLRQIPDATPALDALIVALRDSDWLVRMWSADALARMGPGAYRALPELHRAARDPIPHVRTAVFLAIHWISTQSQSQTQ
jgi:HEAT repeat protein